MSARSPRSQAGQALLFGLLFIGLLCIAIIAMFQHGRLIGTRVSQSHAVDAAAYSGALIQARALNMQAYINLAQIGHQMAMAHLVTLGSWAQFSSTEGNQLGRANPPAYLIAMMFGSKHGVAYRASSRARALASIADQENALNQQFVEHDRLVSQVLARVSVAVQNSMQSARDQAIEQVLKSNYPNRSISGSSHQEADQFTPFLLPYADRRRTKNQSQAQANPHDSDLRWQLNSPSYQQFSAVYRPKGNYRSLITEVFEVYKFLDERNYTANSLLPVSKRCIWKRHQLRRRGHTLLNAQGNWQSIDTQSFHALRSNRWIGCYYREYPMGWGWIPGKSRTVPSSIEYSKTPPDDFSTQDFWRWVQSATDWNIFDGAANPLANSRAISARQRWIGGGLSPYIDINNAKKQASLDFTLNLTQHRVQDHTLKTRSAAQTFFERPTARHDRRLERPNFWHPYWQARLIPLPLEVGDAE